MSRFLVTCLFCLYTTLLAAQTWPGNLTGELQKIADQNIFPGFAVAVVSADTVLYAQGFGFADVTKKQAFTTETVLNIGSVSKTVIGLALLKAVAEGYFTLDTDINKILPFKVENPFFPDAPITLRHLATHTSGITDRESIYNKAYTKNLDSGNLEQYLKDYLTKTGNYYSAKNFSGLKPGQAQTYSNIGSALAAFVVESATKKSFAKYSSDQIFKPLKLQNTAWHFKDINQNRHATLYNKKGQAIPLYSLITYPDGGLKSNLADLSLYLLEIIKAYQGQGTLLPESAYQQVFEPQFGKFLFPENVNPKEPNSGIFWTYRKNGEIGHSGSDPGISAFLFFDPATSIGRIFISNTTLETEAQLNTFADIWSLLKQKN